MFGKFTQRMSIQSACIVYSYEKSLFLKMVFIIGRDWFRVTHMSLNSYPCLGISFHKSLVWVPIGSTFLWSQVVKQ